MYTNLEIPTTTNTCNLLPDLLSKSPNSTSLTTVEPLNLTIPSPIDGTSRRHTTAHSGASTNERAAALTFVQISAVESGNHRKGLRMEYGDYGFGEGAGEVVVRAALLLVFIFFVFYFGISVSSYFLLQSLGGDD